MSLPLEEIPAWQSVHSLAIAEPDAASRVTTIAERPSVPNRDPDIIIDISFHMHIKLKSAAYELTNKNHQLLNSYHDLTVDFKVNLVLKELKTVFIIFIPSG